MDCVDRYWRWPEESNAEHVEDLMDEIRRAFGLDELELPNEWEDSEESWHVARRVDRLMARIAAFVDSGLTIPPAEFAVQLEAIRGLRIRQVAKQHPFADLRKEFGVTSDEPYVAIDVGAEELLKTLIHLRLGYARRHWHVGRIIEVAASGIVARSERGRAYLARMLHCYVLELEDETIVWARAFLAAELESRLEGAAPDEAPLVDLINVAGCSGILSGKVFEAAHRVRTAGNDTLHMAVGLWSLSAVLRDLQDVSRALSRN